MINIVMVFLDNQIARTMQSSLVLKWDFLGSPMPKKISAKESK